uniref:uncharacterized protein LOC120335964 n=1 Tax=Styela clava TaxID=7725 RepID=UPI0019394DBF|nr:uncharacterized protein LOC120335964 [Styela clava]
MTDNSNNIKTKPRYNVRIEPPKPKYGAFGRFINYLRENRVSYTSKIYALGVVGAGLYFLGALVRNIKKEGLETKEIYEEDVKYRFLHQRPEPDSEDEKQLSERIKMKIPDEFMQVEDGPSIVINREKKFVEATTKRPLGMSQFVRIPLEQCEFDNEGNLVLDKYGYPINKGSVINQKLTEKIEQLTTYIQSLEIFK